MASSAEKPSRCILRMIASCSVSSSSVSSSSSSASSSSSSTSSSSNFDSDSSSDSGSGSRSGSCLGSAFLELERTRGRDVSAVAAGCFATTTLLFLGIVFFASSSCPLANFLVIVARTGREIDTSASRMDFVGGSDSGADLLAREAARAGAGAGIYCCSDITALDRFAGTAAGLTAFSITGDTPRFRLRLAVVLISLSIFSTSIPTSSVSLLDFFALRTGLRFSNVACSSTIGTFGEALFEAFDMPLVS